jgi:mono/diheme cytochrome c family protein
MTFSLNRNGVVITILCSFVLWQLPARADEASAKLYQSKCAACHGADGSGNTTVGKTLKIRDLRDPEVQKQSDAELATIIAKGKEKMPAYEKSLKESEIKGLVAYIREAAGKK